MLKGTMWSDLIDLTDLFRLYMPLVDELVSNSSSDLLVQWVLGD